MSKLRLRYIVVLIIVSLFAAFPYAHQQPAGSKTCASLVGTWRITAAKYGGKESNVSARTTTTLKHITPAQFMWVTYGPDGNITRSAGGAYTLAGETYKETPEYGIGSDFEVVKGETHVFTCRIDEPRWYNSGALSNGMPIDEVWERVAPK